MDTVLNLKKTELFHEVDLQDLQALVTRMRPEKYAKGQVLFKIGSAGDTMYIIQKGRIRIYMYDRNGEEITLTHYGEGEIFGELSPIDEKPRSASAVAAEDLEVLALSRADFLSFLNERPQIGIAMMRSLAQRLRNTTTYLEEFKPAQFEPKPISEGQELRKGAQGIIADIIDDVTRAETQEKIEVPPMTKDVSKESLFRDEVSDESLGIFDRIAKIDRDKNEET